jgi:nucleoside-diphosphate-sugar epimerase
MSRIVIIGGSGHVGTYLVPRLVSAGFEVVSVSRGQRLPYQPNGAWKFVRTVTLSRETEENAGAFGRKIRDLRPDIVIDMICFTEASVRHLVDALRGQVRHFLHTGTIWVHGPSVEVPTTEMQPRRPFGEYGIAKARIESYLIEMARKESFPATIIHPGHIVGPGWEPLNPAGHFNPRIFTMLAKGEEPLLPNFGLETVHHVHADDVAQMSLTGARRWARPSTRFHRPRSRFAAMPKRWRHGSAASRSCAICLGWNGRTGKTNWRRRRLTITSLTAPIAASPKRSACSAIGPAIDRSRRCANR